MNILYISAKKSWGGVITWMQITALGLEKRGHKVYILSHPKSAFTKNADKRLKIIPFELGFSYNPIAILKLIRFIKKNKINLILTNIEKEIIAGGIAARICRIPNVRHIGNEGDFRNKLRDKLHHKLLVDFSITISNFTKKESLKKVKWLKKEDIIVIYHGRSLTKFSDKEVKQEKQMLGLSNNDFIIGITSRMDLEKGIEDVIKAFAVVSKKIENLVLVITGLGKDKEYFEKLVKELNIKAKVIFAGFTKKPLLRAACYDIALTYTYNEAIPNTLFEYLAVGCATISSDIGGIPELIIDKKNGLLVEANNYKKLSNKIKLLIENKTLRKKLSLVAADTIKKEFSERTMIKNIEIYFRNSINEKK